MKFVIYLILTLCPFVSNAAIIYSDLNQFEVDPVILNGAHITKARIEIDSTLTQARLYLEHDSKAFKNPMVFIFPLIQPVQTECGIQIYISKIDERLKGNGRRYLQIDDNSKAHCNLEYIKAPTEVTLILKPQTYPQGHTLYSKFYGPALKPVVSFFSNSTRI